NQCSGFLDMLATADAFIRTGGARYVLAVGAEVHSTGIDLSTLGREVAVIFGDGAGAAGRGPEPEPGRGILSTHLHSEGKYAEKLMVEVPNSRSRPRVTAEMLSGPGSRLWPRMEGRYVFKHAVTRFPEVIQEALATNGYTVADLDLLIPHQANLRISQLVAMGLELPEEKVFNNIQRYGNTTAASIPIARLVVAVEEGRSGPAVVGYTCRWRVTDEVHVLNVAVHPERRGRGFGRLLLEGIVGEARSSRARVVYLEVRAGNVVARRL